MRALGSGDFKTSSEQNAAWLLEGDDRGWFGMRTALFPPGAMAMFSFPVAAGSCDGAVPMQKVWNLWNLGGPHIIY